MADGYGFRVHEYRPEDFTSQDLPDDPSDLPLVLDRRGKYPEACLENIGLVLEGLRPWQGVFAYDELAAATLLMRPIPGTSVPRATLCPRELRDGDVIAATGWFNKHLHPRTPHHLVGEVIQQVARQSVLSPVVDYLEGLVWDSVPRLDAWPIAYLGAEDTPFHRAAGRAWLISAVARALKPGCKADHALIFEGGQGVFKSTALLVLASEPWFFDGLRDFNGKDSSQGLRGKWIIELPELAALHRSEVETVKAFLSRTTERYRPSYGRNEVIEPRRCIFAGTTNGRRYLRDTTGNRRFWPIPVGFIDIPALKRDRDQLWAETVVHYRADERWWLDAGMEQVAATIVAERAEEDPWLAPFAEHLIDKSETSTRDCLVAISILPANQTRCAMAQRPVREQDLFRQWIAAGSITGLDGPVIRYRQMARELARLQDSYAIRAVAYDAWRIEAFELDMEEAGVTGLPLVKFGQGWRSMAPAVEFFVECALGGRLRHGNHPVLTACIVNAVTVSDPAGNLKVDKARSRRPGMTRIDGAITSSALGAAQTYTPPPVIDVRAMIG